MKKHGLYISLMPGGKIKRHLSTDFGEMPLPDTSIDEELIALTEHDSTSVMDELGKINSIALDVEEDLSSQNRFQKSFTAFLLRLREKSPVWYTFLKTQLCDTVSETPYEEWNEKQIALFMADGLYHPRGAEITVNLALASLCEDDSDDPYR